MNESERLEAAIAAEDVAAIAAFVAEKKIISVIFELSYSDAHLAAISFCGHRIRRRFGNAQIKEFGEAAALARAALEKSISDGVAGDQADGFKRIPRVRH